MEGLNAFPKDQWPTSIEPLYYSFHIMVGLAAVFLGFRTGRHLLAFLGSSAFILGILAASVWPVMLRSTLDPGWSLTAHNASVAASGLRKGFVWWIIGFPIALGYFTLLFRLFRGKAQAAAEGEGY